PGAPACSAATVDTRALARALTAKGAGSVHVSGCVKGCAHPGRATLTVVGRDGAYDLVKKGHAWDQPQMRGLTADALLALDLMTLSD
ncbi:MAG: cobalamin biosynthesis protein CobG, partial [Tateyamaria sp.]|nr:cobalamin biosynthesis protein CobG [Tateyamaria sp.]